MARAKQTNEDKILGKQKDDTVSLNIDYESPKRKYRITNLVVKNNPVIVTGDVIETFIGCKNKEARQDLIDGMTKVITKDIQGEDLYKIEVIR